MYRYSIILCFGRFGKHVSGMGTAVAKSLLIALCTDKVPIGKWLAHSNPRFDVVEVNDAVDKVTTPPRYRSPALVTDFAPWQRSRFPLGHSARNTTAARVVFSRGENQW